MLFDFRIPHAKYIIVHDIFLLNFPYKKWHNLIIFSPGYPAEETMLNIFLISQMSKQYKKCLLLLQKFHNITCWKISEIKQDYNQINQCYFPNAQTTQHFWCLLYFSEYLMLRNSTINDKHSHTWRVGTWVLMLTFVHWKPAAYRFSCKWPNGPHFSRPRFLTLLICCKVLFLWPIEQPSPHGRLKCQAVITTKLAS